MHPESKLPPAKDRAGGFVLSLLATPLCVPILRAHLDGPLRMADLRERLGGAAQTTLRGQVGNLRGIGALERSVRRAMPYTVENFLSPSGLGVLAVADVVERWLAQAPQGPIALGSEVAKDAIRSLVAGWESTILHALAAHPLSLTELSVEIAELSYPSLERRLSAMRSAGLVEALPSRAGQAKPYAVTEWARQAVVPLIAAARCEHTHFDSSADPLTQADVEAALLLSVPLVTLPANRTGSCLLAVRESKGQVEDHSGAGAVFDLAGVQVELEHGAASSRMSRREDEPQAWVIGAAGAWVAALLEARLDDLRLGGDDEDLAGALVESVHAALRP